MKFEVSRLRYSGVLLILIYAIFIACIYCILIYNIMSHHISNTELLYLGVLLLAGVWSLLYVPFLVAMIYSAVLPGRRGLYVSKGIVILFTPWFKSGILTDYVGFTVQSRHILFRKIAIIEIQFTRNRKWLIPGFLFNSDPSEIEQRLTVQSELSKN